MPKTKNHYIHGDSGTRLFKIWCGMRKRCNCKTYYQYYLYGGRGIKICDEWENYINFKKWALKNNYNNNLSIDRIDTNKNYEPNNCRWVDKYTQANNKRNNVKITYNNETHTIAEWSKILNIPYPVLWQRHKKKWKAEDILFKEYRKLKEI